MAESLACGTPVIGWRNGSVPEIIDNGVTGFVVERLEDAVAAVGRIGEIDRAKCRLSFEARFDVTRMARDYVEVYRKIQPCKREAAQPPHVDGGVASRPARPGPWSRVA